MIVAPNYRDREDKARRWLVKDKEETPKTSCILTDGTFGRYDYNAAEFGCGTQAKGKECKKFYRPPANAIKLKFTGKYFRNDKTDEIVSSFQRLFLAKDGSIHAVL
jgi:hypothetical protein